LRICLRVIGATKSFNLLDRCRMEHSARYQYQSFQDRGLPQTVPHLHQSAGSEIQRPKRPIEVWAASQKTSIASSVSTQQPGALLQSSRPATSELKSNPASNLSNHSSSPLASKSTNHLGDMTEALRINRADNNMAERHPPRSAPAPASSESDSSKSSSSPTVGRKSEDSIFLESKLGRHSSLKLTGLEARHTRLDLVPRNASERVNTAELARWLRNSGPERRASVRPVEDLVVKEEGKLKKLIDMGVATLRKKRDTPLLSPSTPEPFVHKLCGMLTNLPDSH
jgi:hypothetical protein